jgi:ABC-type dipeptide/oligopeptide/nickel transport system permease component
MIAIWLTKHGIKVVKVAGSGSVNHMILPVIALAILPACYIARVAAMSIENCYKMEYVKTALGKGCSKSRILWNHVMRNAARIVVESFTDITSIIIYNMIMVEYLFAYPGITTFLMKSVAEHDTNAITVSVVLFGLIYLLLTILFKIIKFTTLRYDMEETA